MRCRICFKDNCSLWMHSLEEIESHEKMLKEYKEDWEYNTVKVIESLAEYDEDQDRMIVDLEKLLDKLGYEH